MNVDRIAEAVGLQAKKDASDIIYEKFSRLIVSGELEEGSIFPNETELCAQLNVGRTTLREAYKALELAGYITRTKRGTRVNGKRQILNSTPLVSIVSAASEDEFNEFRILQESQCAYIAANKAALDDVEKLTGINEKLNAAYGQKDLAQMASCDIEFHLAVAEMCRNTLVSATMNVIYERLKDSVLENFRRALTSGSDIVSVTIEQHNGIIEAIRSRDMDLAAGRMKEHIITAINTFSS